MKDEQKPTHAKQGTETQEVIRHFRMFTWLSKAQLKDLFKMTFSAWSEDNVPRLGASLAYYTALSLAPLIVVVLAVAGLAFGRQAVQGQLVWEIQDTVGHDAARVIQELIQSANKPASGILASVLGLAALFFGATSAVVELTDALNTIWHVQPDPTQTGIKSMFRLVRLRFISFAMVLGIGFLLLVSLVASAWLAAMGRFFDKFLPIPEWALHALNFLISFLVITLLFAMIYKVLPEVALRWSDVVIGASVTSLLFSIGKTVLGLYLGKSTIGSTYGAAGSFVVLLVWVYYSAQIFFLGAEFTRSYTTLFGSHLTGRLHLHPERQESLLVDPSGAGVGGEFGRTR